MSDKDPNTQDNLPEGGQPSGGKGKTSTKTPKTYTEAEFQKAHSDREAEAGRRRKAEGEIKTLKEQMADLQRQNDERELAGIGEDNPEAKASLQLKKQLRDANARLRQMESDLEIEREKSKKSEAYERLEKAREFISGYENLDPHDLVDIPEERWEAFAKRYGKPKGETPPEEEGYKPDSGVTSGGGLDLNKLSPEEKIYVGVQRQKK